MKRNVKGEEELYKKQIGCHEQGLLQWLGICAGAGAGRG
jgi:hypothetical protein